MSNWQKDRIAKLNDLKIKMNRISTGPRFNAGMSPNWNTRPLTRGMEAQMSHKGANVHQGQLPQETKKKGTRGKNNAQKKDSSDKTDPTEVGDPQYLSADAFYQIVEGLKANCDSLTDTVRRQDILIQNQEAIINELIDRSNAQTVHINALDDRVDQLEQQTNADKVIFSGPLIERLRKRSNVSSRLESEDLTDDLSRTGLGDRSVDVITNWAIADDKIVVKFKGEVPRSIFIRAPPPVDESGAPLTTAEEPFYISDLLTKRRSNILYQLRGLRKDHKDVISRVASRHGRPGVFYGTDPRITFVDTPSALDKLKRQLQSARPRQEPSNASHDRVPEHERHNARPDVPSRHSRDSNDDLISLS